MIGVPWTIFACAFVQSAPASTGERAPRPDGAAVRIAEPDRRATDERRAALARDPSRLARAPEGRWLDFAVAKRDAKDLPPGMVEAARALAARDLPLALTALYRVLDAEPEYPPAMHELGVVYFKLQRYRDGIEAFERFLRSVPSLVGETRALGHCYYTLGEYARAEAHYARVVAAAPDDVEALRGWGLSFMRLGDTKRAEELLRKVLELAPSHADATAWLAQVLFDDGRSDEALPLAERARDLDPSQPRPWFLLGKILFELGREKEAVRAEARYEELGAAAQKIRGVESRLLYAPRQLSLLLELVELHRDTGNVAKTREALASVLAERPEDVDLRIYALDVLQRMGDADGSRLAAETLERVGADEPRAWQRLESYYAAVKDRVRQVRAGERYRRLQGH